MERMNETVLVVDDELIVVQTIARHLSSAGYTVLTASKGEKALHIYEREAPDILLIDLHIPPPNGLEVLRTIQEQDPDAEVILITGHGGIETAIAALRAGASDFLPKPIRVEDLNTALDRANKRLRLKRELQATQEELQRQSNNLRKRNNELNCLYGISTLIETPDMSWHDIIQGTIDLIPAAWQYPEITVARVFVSGREFKTDAYRDTPWKQSSAITVYNEPVGILEVGYLEERPPSDEGPFQAEERYLLNAITERLGRILERMQAEAELRKGEAWYRLLFNLSEDAILVYHLEDETQHGAFIEVNEAATRKLGYTKEELLNLSPSDIHTPEANEQALQRIEEITDKKHILFETEYIAQNGDRIPVEVNAHFFELNGQPTVLSIARDISERVQVQEELRRDRNLLDRIMETSPAAITMVDCEGYITFANQRAESILGLTKNEITARTYDQPDWRITDFDDHPFPEQKLPFQQVIATRQAVYDVRHAIHKPNGSRVLLSISGAPLTDDNGETEGAVFVFDDITERVEEERRHIEQLERELRFLDMLSSLPQTATTAHMFGVQTLRQHLPNTFQEQAETYGELLDLALKRRIYRAEYDISEKLRAIAERLGVLRAGPRDVIEIHTTALKFKSENVNSIKAQAYAEEGRLIALELMGYLVSYYRNRSIDNKPGRSEILQDQ